MIATKRNPRGRRGGVYIAVLGTSLIVSVLAMAALVTQRIQNRLLTASADIRQAQLNAHSATELARLAIAQDDDWRSSFPHGPWFTDRATGGGTCSVEVLDPLDADLASDPDAPFVIRGIGTSGQAMQRVEMTIDPRRQPADILLAAAESAKAGAPLAGQAAELDWDALFADYGVRGRQIVISSLPTRTRAFSRNMEFNAGKTHWTGTLPSLPQLVNNPDSNLTVTSFSNNPMCLRVERSDKRAGAANRLDAALLKPDTLYQVRFDINPNLGVLNLILGTLEQNTFRVRLVAEYSDGSAQLSPNSIVQTLHGAVLGSPWTSISGTLRTPDWSTHPVEVYLLINSDHSNGTTKTFYIDNLDVYEGGARFIHQKALGPGVNPFGPADPLGIYWIDCNGSTLIIERSRIRGTLVLLNPGSASRVEHGPIHMSPHEPGYPPLLVDGNFTIKATDRVLSETENSSPEHGIVANYNPAGMPYDFGTTTGTSSDNDTTDIYPSEIRGLVAVSGNLTFANTPRIFGQAIVGGNVTGAADLEFRPDSLLSPPPGFWNYRYDLRPASVRKTVQ